MLLRTYNIAPLFLGTDGLTDAQEAELTKLWNRNTDWLRETDPKAKKKLELTDNMKAKLDELLTLKEKFESGDAPLPKGARSLIEEYVEAEVYEYKDSVETKEMNKGISVEDECIDLYNQLFFTDYVKSGLVLSYNNIEGHPDIVDYKEKKIKDAKSSWNKKTFPKTVEQADNSTYVWQVRTYLYCMQGMTGDKEWCSGEVFYGLVDTPENLVPEYENDTLHYASNLPTNLRITVLPVDLTEDHIRHMDRRIKMAEKYYDEYKNLLINKNK